MLNLRFIQTRVPLIHTLKYHGNYANELAPKMPIKFEYHTSDIHDLMIIALIRSAVN